MTTHWNFSPEADPIDGWPNPRRERVNCEENDVSGCAEMTSMDRALLPPDGDEWIAVSEDEHIVLIVMLGPLRLQK